MSPTQRVRADDKYAFVLGLIASHGERLRRFLARRLRGPRADVADLTQEVYLRLLRISRPESIRNPEAYLFTIASHVLHQNAIRQGTQPEAADALDVLAAQDPGSDPAGDAALAERLEALSRALAPLPFKTQAALILYRRDGYSLGEVARALEVSEAMVKKHLSRAILHCSAAMAEDL